MFHIGTMVNKLLLFLDISILCNTPPSGWPQEYPKHVTRLLFFDVLLTVHLFILVINQHDAQNFVLQ